MRPLREIFGPAVPYSKSNVDTDEIIPARFLLRDRREGFSDFLFRDLSFDADGVERPEFILNQARYRNAKVLVAGSNFGCGSSREHAVWALLDYGIDAVVAPSFGDIFRNNAVQNGLLLVALPAETIDHLVSAMKEAGDANVKIDLAAQKVFCSDGHVFSFDIDPYDKKNLIEGRSKIDETLALESEIERFERNYRASFPWTAHP
jgi:3-isopropylmalate/(R)-2-methylmalate dehydratase small subunit